MKPALLRHPASRLISPYQQGQLDFLCGLYALLNALRLLYAPNRLLSRRACEKLFALGLESLGSRPTASYAAHCGMSIERQAKLAKLILRSTGLQNLPQVLLRPALPRITSVGELDGAVRSAISHGDVLLVCFEGRLSHHSVIVGVSASRVVLSDSIGMHFVSKASLQLGAKPRGTLIVDGLAPIGLR